MIFLVTRVGFDDLENRIENAMVRRCLGYAETEAEAEAAIVVARLKDCPDYKGWDGRTYPRYEVERVDRVK